MRHYYLILVFSLFFIHCKKDKDPFEGLIGDWKPVSFNYYQGTKTFPSDFNYSLNKNCDSLYYAYLPSDTTFKYEYRVYKLAYSIKTYKKDNSVLVVDEHYMGLDSAGNVVQTAENRTEVNIVQGQTEYGNPNYKQTISPDRIKTSLYTTSGLQYTIMNSELVKME